MGNWVWLIFDVFVLVGCIELVEFDGDGEFDFVLFESGG